jgi:hypothetical protein
MRIRRLDVFTARLPLEPGFSHFTGRVTALEEVFVRLTADGGHVGWGEVRGNMSYFSGESPASIVAALRDYLAPLVVGRTLRECATAIAQFDLTGEPRRPMTGRATPRHTAGYAARMSDAAPGHFRRAHGRLVVSSIGLGTYGFRADGRNETVDRYIDTIHRVLAGGVNVTDTASNYGAGTAETVVGAALRSAFARSGLLREEIVVTTKGAISPTRRHDSRRSSFARVDVRGVTWCRATIASRPRSFETRSSAAARDSGSRPSTCTSCTIPRISCRT